jgi:prepilin-type N-terminal cleavage/methylation domain-containing protein
MVMKKAFTLIEMVVTIVILGVLSAGTFVSLQHLYLRMAKSKAVSELSFESQMIVDQISALMYDRVPSSVIGYNSNVPEFQSIYAIDGNFTILEWIGTASEAYKMRFYSGFIDMDASQNTSFRLSSAGISKPLMDALMVQKFGTGTTSHMGLVFAGSFDDGAIYYSNEFNTSFGWHGNTASKIFPFTPQMDGNISLITKPDEIFEKYYIVDTAYAVARGADITLATCPDANMSVNDNTLLLFYDYRPWSGETFCGDKGVFGGVRAGKVTILSNSASGFQAGVINGSIYFNLTLERIVRGSENTITISKQKAVY